MSNLSTPPERDTQLLNVGQQCSAPSCLLVDFLPFKCQHCAHSFCGEHFLPELHKCDKFDASKHNRVAPSCPLCNTPVAVPSGQDPNIRMERHITSECSVMTGKSGKTSSSPHCANPKCRKVLFAPIRCNTCKQQFCPQHRFPNAHACRDKTTPNSVSASATKASQPIRPAAVSAAAMSAIKRAMASASASAPSLTSSSVSKAPPAAARTTPQTTATTTQSSSSSSRTNPFSAVDRSLPAPAIDISSAHDTAHDNANDPPARCAPNLNISSNISDTLSDPLSFIPRSLFTSA